MPQYTKILVEDRPGVRRFVLVPIIEVSPIPVVVAPPPPQEHGPGSPIPHAVCPRPRWTQPGL